MSLVPVVPDFVDDTALSQSGGAVILEKQGFAATYAYEIVVGWDPLLTVKAENRAVFWRMMGL